MTMAISGCGYSPISTISNNTCTITSIEFYNKDFSMYYGSGRFNPNIMFANSSFAFIDSSRKFNIGDTISFYKFHK